MSRNFYWLSTREDVLDWKKTKWYYTPTKVHADLTALAAAAGHDARGFEPLRRLGARRGGDASWSRTPDGRSPS